MLDQNNIDRSSVTYWVLDRCHILCTAAVSFTSYSESQERICITARLAYCDIFFSGVRWNFGLRRWLLDWSKGVWRQENTVTLIENKSVLSMFGLTILVKKMVRSDLETCYTIASDWNTEASVNVGRFQVDFHLKSQVWPRSLARFWVTSEDNSYGLVWSQWFDWTTTKGPIQYIQRRRLRFYQPQGWSTCAACPGGGKGLLAF